MKKQMMKFAKMVIVIVAVAGMALAGSVSVNAGNIYDDPPPTGGTSTKPPPPPPPSIIR